MCGIVFVKNNGSRKACRTVFNRYEQQSKRGTQGYGAVSIADNIVRKVYRSQDVNGIKDIYQDNADTILFHHRTPTSTPNYIECTHPIFVSNEKLDSDYLIVHNGVINNADTLRREFEKEGFIYTTAIQEMYISKITGKIYPTDTEKFNDSESFAIDLALAIEGNLPQLKSRGSMAFVALQISKEDSHVVQVFFGRNIANPLKMDRRNDNFVLASEGIGEDVVPHKLYSYDMGNGEVDITDLEIGIKYTIPEKTAENSDTHKVIYPEGYFSSRDVRTPTQVISDNSKQLNLLGTAKTTTQRKLEASSFEDRLDKAQIKIYATDKDCDEECEIEVPILDNRLYRTNIDIMDFGIVTKDEWFKYLQVDKDITSYLKIYKEGRQHGLILTDDDRRVCSELLSNNFKWLKEFAKNVHHRAILSNKF